MKSGLYLITGLFVTYQTFFSVMAGVYGAPINPLEYVALLGAVVLIVASLIHIWNKSFGVKLVLACLLSMWVFYLPAYVYMLAHAHEQIACDYAMYRSNKAMGVHFPSWIVMNWVRILVGFALLILSTFVAARDGFNRFGSVYRTS